MPIENERLAAHDFLAEMVADSYYPAFLTTKCQQVLIDLCEQIEATKPATDEALFALTHAATERYNQLAEEFYEHDSDLETVAREAIAADIMLILEVYGFDVDIEEAIANRDW